MNYYNRPDDVTINDVRSQSAFAVLMRKVYVWMTLAMAVTGLTAYYVASDPELIYKLFAQSSAPMWILIIAELGLVMIISSAINRLSFATAGLLFILYSVLNGVTLSVIFLAYTLSSIATTFFVTAGTFGAMSIFGYTTRRNLSGLGRILIMALIGLIIATLVNIFVKSSGLQAILNYIGVLVFVGLTAYDTQKIKLMFQQDGGEVNESTQKLALLGSLTLYLDFINLFLYLLRLLGDRRG